MCASGICNLAEAWGDFCWAKLDCTQNLSVSYADEFGNLNLKGMALGNQGYLELCVLLSNFLESSGKDILAFLICFILRIIPIEIHPINRQPFGTNEVYCCS